MGSPEPFGDKRIDFTPPSIAGAIFEIHEKVDELIAYVNERLEESGGCHIPSDFPHRDILRENGIDSLCSLAEYDDFQDLHGIGPAKADELEQAFKEL